jgi:hypothetical protein
MASIPKYVLAWFSHKGFTNELRILLYMKYVSGSNNNGRTSRVNIKALSEDLKISRQTTYTCINRLQSLKFINKATRGYYYVRSWKKVYEFCKQDLIRIENASVKAVHKIPIKYIFTSKKIFSAVIKSSFIIRSAESQDRAIRIKSRNISNFSTKGDEAHRLMLSGDKIGSWFGKSARSGRNYMKTVRSLGIIDYKPIYKELVDERGIYCNLKRSGDYPNLFESRGGKFIICVGSEIEIKNHLDIEFIRGKF